MLAYYLTLIDAEEERKKFEQIYWKYCKLVFCISMWILHNNDDAEDAVQNTFLQIARNIKDFEDPAAEKTKSLVALIARQRALDLRKARRRKSFVPLDEVLQIKDANQAYQVYQQPEEEELLQKVLAQMNERYRDILILRFYHDYSTEEIAKFFSIREDNARKLFQRAREQFIALYQREIS